MILLYNELSITNINDIDILIDQYIEKYINIPKSSNPETVHHPSLFQFPKNERFIHQK